MSPEVASALRQASVSSTPHGLHEVGADRGFLVRASGSLASHPDALSFLLNSDAVTSAFLGRPEIQADCHNTAALESGLGVTLGSYSAQALVGSPDAVAALVGSRVFQSFEKCPAFRQLASDPNTIARIVAQHPGAQAVVSSPGFARGLRLAGISQRL
jgi:hypothetical protein